MDKIIGNKIIFSEFIQFSFVKFILIYTLIFQFFFIFIIQVSFLFNLLLYFLFLEIFILITFLFFYKKGYRNSIWLYSLVDHNLYGYSFRKNFASKCYEGFLFDNFLFPNNIPRLTKLNDNKELRVNFNVNSLGFRGNDFSIKKNKNTIRIFCSGGSTTAGDSCNDNGTWPFFLEQEFRKNNYDVEVINAGVIGYYSRQELLRLQSEIIYYDPDIILMHQGWNEEFEYSSQNLGKDYISGKVRNVSEANQLYIKSNRFFSQRILISLHFLFNYIFVKRKFIPLMSFNNPNRWKCLKKYIYIEDWYKNQIEFASLSLKHNFMLFNIKYPSLVNIYDLPDEREFFIKNSRLTNLFAEYQSISKYRIDEFIDGIDALIPKIDANKNFNEIEKEDKMKLFFDEIHMTESGNQILAKNIYTELEKNLDFRKLIKDKVKISNILEKEYKNFKTKKLVKKNASFINRKIDKIVSDLVIRNINVKLNDEISTSRYTTF